MAAPSMKAGASVAMGGSRFYEPVGERNTLRRLGIWKKEADDTGTRQRVVSVMYQSCNMEPHCWQQCRALVIDTPISN